jgi:hypothetical protein
MKKNLSDQHPDLKKQKAHELLTEFAQGESFEEARENIQTGIVNFTPLMGSILEQCPNNEIEDFFYSLKRLSGLLKQLANLQLNVWEVSHES